MTYYDVFNGDADGVCALIQLRNAEPRNSTLITGVKRDISLLKQVKAQAGDVITVLDVSMEKNIDALQTVLTQGASVFYVDHHRPGEIPDHSSLNAIIDEDPHTCTCLLVNKHLNDAYVYWAIAGAFGDNMLASAVSLSKKHSVDTDTQKKLENLGTYINYNGYGSEIGDLHFHPADLFRLMSPFSNPLDFMSGDRENFEKLETGYHQDMGNAASTQPVSSTGKTAVMILPNEPWSRRVSGVYGNSLANDFPDRAHAIVTENKDGTYVISVRAPLSNRTGAGDLCSQFPTGGGRAAAAGINKLPQESLDNFIDTFNQFYSA